VKTLETIEVVEDRTTSTPPGEGFLRLRRLLLRNHYEDGGASRPYACDIVSRRHVDAVAVVVWSRDADVRVRVALRTGVRPPIVMRQEKNLPHDEREYGLIAEIVAGVIEEEDSAAGGVERRGAVECEEEAGYEVDPSALAALGAPTFPTPGVTDEMVHFRAAEVEDLGDRRPGRGDGSVMEEAGDVVVLPLREAIRRCRTGEIPDMKTEIGLLRLCDALGYVPALDRFVDELPEPYRLLHADLPPLLDV
jgi:ADP-ribose pyrophosphatase